MVTAHSCLYQSRPGDARNIFRNSSSLLFALRLPEPLHQFLGEVGREFHHGACQRAKRRLGFAATASASASTPAWRGLRRSSARPASVGSRVDLDAAALAFLSGLPFTAAEAEAWGLVNRVVEAPDLLETTMGIARRIAANGPVAVRQAKQAIHRGMQMSLWEGLAFEIEAYNRLVPTEDRREGVLAFNEHRKPIFRGV
jgi:enoyl-CoA hydratase/carnithine racemase